MTGLRQHGLALTIWAIGGLSLAYLVLRLHGFYQDDAFISLTYARNLLDGDGLSWNPGERIEGYSNFGFVLLAAGLGALGLDLVLASKLIGVGFGIATVVATFGIYSDARDVSGSRLATPVGTTLGAVLGTLVAASLPLVAWSFGGLETTLFTFLVTMGVRGTLQLAAPAPPPAWPTGLWFGLAVVTRPDGVVFWAAAILFLAGRATLRPSGIAVATRVALGALLVLAPYLVWKLWYFGELLPNTYYAKSAGIPLSFKIAAGVDYLMRFAGTPPALGLLAVAALVLRSRAPARGAARRGAAVPFAAWSCAVFAGYQVLVGGDFMNHFRFFVPLIPLLALVLVLSLRDLALAGRVRTAIGIGIAAVALNALPLAGLDPASGSTSALVAEVAAPHIEGNWPAGALVAINASGALPYLQPGYRYLDMLGLNDAHIARRPVPDPRGQVGHLKGDGAYVLSRDPDYILLGFPYGADDDPVFLGDRELRAGDQLEERYRKVTVSLAVPAALRDRFTRAANDYPTIRYSQGTLQFTYYEKAPA